MKRACTIDIETSDLLANMLDYTSFPYKLRADAKLWVVSITYLNPFLTKTFVGEEITKEALRDALEGVDIIILHNGIKFDLPTLMLFGVLDYRIGYIGERDSLFGREVRFVDSLIMSRLSNPDRLGGHSLDSWGHRVGVNKIDYRSKLIELGVIEKSLPKGMEFRFFHEEMIPYCNQDTVTNAYAYMEILKEYEGYDTCKTALQQEQKLADLAVRRETLGFWFDKDLALKNLDFLTEKMKELSDVVTPLLPKKPLNKGELSDYTPPAVQFKADGSLSHHMKRFIDRHDCLYDEVNMLVEYKGKEYGLPLTDPLETHRESSIDDLDVVKEYLISLGWSPSEWKERDLTKDSKKQTISVDKRLKAVGRYVEETLNQGKYKEDRLKFLGVKEHELLSFLERGVRGNRSVKVITSPCVRVGVTKDLCPNLVKMGEEVSFAKDFSEYLTYKHRKSCIAGGDIEDMDLDIEVPNTGYLTNYREEDGRIPTPSIEIGASTQRYRHISVANVPRPSSLFGKEMRGMFGCGKDFVQFGFDYASLEARIQAHFVYDYEGGKELGESLLAEKPLDIHTKMGESLSIDRSDAKSVNYMFMYGGSASKVVKMLGYTMEKAKQFHEDWWNTMLPLKKLKEDKEREWMESGKKFIRSLDGRRINIRSQHSIINALFQSSGVIFAKYVTVLICQEFERLGLCIDPFIGKPDVCSMIEYHDEQQQLVDPKLLNFKKFNTEEEATEFCSSWSGGQLGAIQKSSKGGYYVTLPSVISETISTTIRNVEEMFSVKVPMGYEYVVGRNWADCH